MADLTLKLRGAEVTEPKTVDEKYFVVLRNYVRGTEISARDAAENTDHLTPSPKHPVDGKTDPEEHLFAFWNALFDIASQIPAVDEDKHGRLVALVRQLTELSSGTVTIWGTEKDLWKDVPLIGAVLRENWNEPDEHMAVEKLSGWVNKNAFLAILVNSRIDINPPLLEFPIWTIRGALEEEFKSASPFTETRIAAAAQWFKHAADFLFDESAWKGISQDETFLRMTAPGKLFPGGSGGLSSERLVFWRDRLEEVSRNVQDEEVRALARDAASRARASLAQQDTSK